MIDKMMTRSCNTRLCLRLCSSAFGTPSGLVVMKMPVPATLCGGLIEMESTNNFSGMALSLVTRRTICRPRYQVLMIVNMMAPITKGNHPPSAILTKDAERNMRSLARMPVIQIIASHLFQRQMRAITTNSKRVSIVIVNITAMP